MIDSPAALLLLLAAVVAVPVLLKRHRASTPDGVRVVGRTALSKGAVVAVVAVGRRRLLVGAGERGVQLLAELDPAADDAGPDGSPTVTFTTTTTTTTTALDRTDAATALGAPRSDDDALAALVDLDLGDQTTAGPGIGLVDRLRAMTVRTPVSGRPLHVPFRR